MSKVIDFIKYHNLFTIILGLVLISTAGVFASPDLKNAVVGEKIETFFGIDNTFLLSADLENFDLALTIKNVDEDEENYYVDYVYNFLGIVDNIWQSIVKKNTLTVAKNRLGENDLGLYVQEEVGEFIDYELRQLKEVQAIENQKGITQLAVTTEYTGLIGMVFDNKNKVLPGYKPVKDLVVKPEPDSFAWPQPEPGKNNQGNNSNNNEQNNNSNKKVLGCTDSSALNYNSSANQNDGSCKYPNSGGDNNSDPILGCMDDTAENYNPDATEDDGSCDYPESETESQPEPICDLDNLDLCLDENSCLDAIGYWYNDVCNAETEPAEAEPQPELVFGCTDETATNYNNEATEDDGSCEYPPTCDADNLDLCTDETSCAEAIGYWYNDVCNAEAEPAEAEPQPEPVLGCTDDTANNYNLDATEDDGSCTYPESDPEE